MKIINLLKDLDNKFTTEVKVEEKNNIQLGMLLIECKYNLDIIDAIDFEKSSNNDPQLREVIKLLSTEALEKLILNGTYKSDSVFMRWMYKAFNQITEVNITSEGLEEQISPNDTLLFNMYKRITVMQSLVIINPPFTSLKNINYLKRLKNLKEVLLDINSKIKL